MHDSSGDGYTANASQRCCWWPLLCMRAVTLVSECVIKGVTGLPWHTPKKRKKNGTPLDSFIWLFGLPHSTAVSAPPLSGRLKLLFETHFSIKNWNPPTFFPVSLKALFVLYQWKSSLCKSLDGTSKVVQIKKKQRKAMKTWAATWKRCYCFQRTVRALRWEERHHSLIDMFCAWQVGSNILSSIKSCEVFLFMWQYHSAREKKTLASARRRLSSFLFHALVLFASLLRRGAFHQPRSFPRRVESDLKRRPVASRRDGWVRFQRVEKPNGPARWVWAVWAAAHISQRRPSGAR